MIRNVDTRVMVMFAAIALLSGCDAGDKIEVTNMRCEYAEAPLGIDTPDPRFTWTYEAAGDGVDFRQAGFRVNVASSAEELSAADAIGDVWTAVFPSKAMFAEYSGEPLLSHRWYYWNIVAAGEDGETTVVSPVARFRTAKMRQDEWQASWITDGHDMSFGPAPMMRRAFAAEKQVGEAYLYISAAAYYSAAINGREVTPNRLDPGYTHYDKRNLYATHDVTDLITQGENVITAVLGNGFYNEDAPVATWDFERARWRDRPRMICELHIEYTDGTRDVVASDGSWKTTADGPYVYNNIYSGDAYDARLEIPGWDKPGFDDNGWNNAVVARAPSPMLVSQHAPAIRTTQKVAPVHVQSWGDTVFVFDFGKNMAGVCELKVSGEAGTKVVFEHGELLKPDGRVEMGNLVIYYKPLPGVAFQTDTYILKGDGIETYTPQFTYHGFRYVEVRSDRPVKIQRDGMIAHFVHTAVEPVGRFECSNDLFNKIWAATNRSYLSNLHSIPTDCPQREKNGWTADGWISMDIGLMNYDGIRLYEKWLDDFIDNQLDNGRVSGIVPSSGWGYDDWIGPVWDAALFIIPDVLERYYGTTRYIDRMYPTCERYLEYLATREEPDGTVTYGIGDWVYYNTQTPTDFTSSCFYYLDNRLMAEFAAKTGRDGSKYAAKAAQLKQVINDKYFDRAAAIYANGSQAALGVALWLEIVPEEYAQRVADNLNRIVVGNDCFLDFGTLGSKSVPRMLAKYGHVDTAYKMASKTDAPSWGAWIEQGFTTLAERWVLDLVNFRDSSVNHVFLGDISAWMYQALAGINSDPQERGFRRLIFEPHFPEGLDWVEAEYRSPAGMVKAAWKRRGSGVTYKITVPVNTSAEVRIGGEIHSVGAGSHTFRTELY